MKCYTLTAKLAHRLYDDSTVVDYNLFIIFFNSGDVKYPAHARLQKIKTHSCPVIQDKHEHAIITCSVVHLCASPYKGISWQSADGVTPMFGIVC